MGVGSLLLQRKFCRSNSGCQAHPLSHLVGLVVSLRTFFFLNDSQEEQSLRPVLHCDVFPCCHYCHCYFIYGLYFLLLWESMRSGSQAQEPSPHFMLLVVWFREITHRF